MKHLTAVELLGVWEQGMNRNLLQKTLDLLALACPEMDADSIAKLSIGERNARLLLLREWIFGSRLINMADCPACSKRSEWESDVADYRLQSVPWDQSLREFNFDLDEYSIRFRLPNSNDISMVIGEGTEQTDPTKLLSNCILEIRYNGKDCDIDDLPDKVLQALTRRMEEEDPRADIRIALNCPHCSHRWQVQFDIASYFWTEINSWAERMLHDVYILARAFGWSEHDILNMSSSRRQLYLGMVNL